MSFICGAMLQTRLYGPLRLVTLIPADKPLKSLSVIRPADFSLSPILSSCYVSFR